jgi:DNA-binding transcriptional LysR family regulator
MKCFDRDNGRKEMDVKYLNYIITIAEEKNLHKAAKKLYVSQPSLSQYLTRLEAELGTPLFIRTSRELVITEAGQLYVDTARQIVAMRNKLYRDIANLKYESHLSIATSSKWGRALVSAVLPEFKNKYPDVMVEITESFFPSMSYRLKNREIDLCLVSVLETDLDYQVTPLGVEHYWMAISKDHTFCIAHNPSDTIVTMKMLVQELGTESYISTSKRSTTQTLMENLFRENNFHPRIFGYFDNITTVLQLVADGAGIAFVPDSCVDRSLPVQYFKMESNISRQHIIAYRKNLPMTPPVVDLLTSIQKEYKIMYPG